MEEAAAWRGGEKALVAGRNLGMHGAARGGPADLKKMLDAEASLGAAVSLRFKAQM